jgi:hypothetical protein
MKKNRELSKPIKFRENSCFSLTLASLSFRYANASNTTLFPHSSFGDYSGYEAVSPAIALSGCESLGNCLSPIE